jgi:hypothetical protein
MSTTVLPFESKIEMVFRFKEQRESINLPKAGGERLYQVGTNAE